MQKFKEALIQAYKSKDYDAIKHIKREIFKELSGGDIDLLLKLIECDEMIESARITAYKESQEDSSI